MSNCDLVLETPWCIFSYNLASRREYARIKGTAKRMEVMGESACTITTALDLPLGKGKHNGVWRRRSGLGIW